MQGGQKFVDHVRVRTAVSSALNERKVFRILNRPRKTANRFRQKMRVIRDCDARGNFRLRFFRRVKNVFLVFDQRPFETF